MASRREGLASAVGVALAVRDLRAVVSLARLSKLTSCHGGTFPDVIAIAVARERPELVRDTVVHMRALAPGVPIVVVLPSGDQSASLLAPVDVELHMSRASGRSKGALMNDFVRRCELDDDAFVTIYDADSRPTTVRHHASRCHPVSQQTSTYRPADRGSGYWSGFALNQTLWARSYELRALTGGRAFYLVGHGLTIQLSLLRELPFREDLPGEDLLLGYQLSLRGVHPQVSPGTDVAEVSVSLAEHVRQGGRWFVGELTALGEVSRTHGPTMLAARRGAGLLFWLAGPIVVGSFVRASMRPGRSAARIAACAALGMRSLLYVWLTHEVRPDRPHRTSWLSRVAAAIGFATKPIVAACAAWWGLAQMIDPDKPGQMRKSRLP